MFHLFRNRDKRRQMYLHTLINNDQNEHKAAVQNQLSMFDYTQNQAFLDAKVLYATNRLSDIAAAPETLNKRAAGDTKR
jgi:hypothetical protein